MRRRSVFLLCALGLAVGASAATWAAFSSSTASSGNTFSAAASFCNGSALNPVWMTGFEEGVATLGYDAGSNASLDSATKRSGSYSMRLNSTGGNAYTAKAVSSAVVTLRFAVRFPSLPAADLTSLTGTIAGTGSSASIGYRSADQKLVLRWGAGAAEASSMAIAAGTWYVIDLRVNVGANPRTADWRIDGVAQTSASVAEPVSTISYIGTGSNVAGDVFSANYDDILATTSGSDYPIGPGSVLALKPDGVLAHNNPGNFRQENGTAITATSWNRLDDVPMDSIADGVYQSTGSTTSYLAFSFENPSTTCIKAVGATVAYRSPGSGGGPGPTGVSGKTSVFDGSTERIVFSGDMSNSGLRHASTMLSPASGSSWTQSAVDALSARIGYATGVKPWAGWEALQLNYEAQ